MRQRTILAEPGSSEVSENNPNMFPFDRIEGGDEETDSVRQKRIRSIVVTATALLLGGFVLLIVGLAMYVEGRDRIDWIPPMGLGAMCIVPGSYATGLAYGAYKKWPGYSWEALPTYQNIETD